MIGGRRCLQGSIIGDEAGACEAWWMLVDDGAKVMREVARCRSTEDGVERRRRVVYPWKTSGLSVVRRPSHR